MSNTKPALLIGAITMAASVAPGIAQSTKPFTLPGTGQPPAQAAPPKAAAAAVTTTQPPAEQGVLDKFFNGKVPDAIAKGKFSINARLRYEFVNQDKPATIRDDAHAITLRTRFGFTTAPVYGFQAMIEGEDIHVIGPKENFNAAGSNGQPGKPIVADPPTDELNQAWLSYTYTNLFSVKGGRQRITLDNHRFIGDVGWRQNMQTFDAAVAEVKPVKDLSIYYGYVWDVHRVFGDVAGLPAANRDFDSKSHLINVSYTPFKYGRVAAYSYLLDLQNAAGAANSCATYGGYFAGNADVTEKISLGYRAEFAWQTDYGKSPLNYQCEYLNFELSAAMKPFAAGVGYEQLGTDNGTSFRTPLATLHAFNGWADVFLTTPAAGLQDKYAFIQYTLPWQVPLRFVYHKFDADAGGADFGHEFDVVATKVFSKYWTTTLKYAFYHGEDAAPPSFAVAHMDVQKLWAQVEFNY